MSIKGSSHAEIAQLVEHFTRNEGVAGSNPVFSFGANAVDISVCAVFLYLFRNYVMDVWHTASLT